MVGTLQHILAILSATIHTNNTTDFSLNTKIVIVIVIALMQY